HFPHRFAFLREAIAAMRKLWTEELPSFEGRWVRFPPVICRPKPVQEPHPRVILGGMGLNARKGVAAWGDGWLPIGLPPDDLAEARREISRRALERDRHPETISRNGMTRAPRGLARSLPPPAPPTRRPARGTARDQPSRTRARPRPRSNLPRRHDRRATRARDAEPGHDSRPGHARPLPGRGRRSRRRLAT